MARAFGLHPLGARIYSTKSTVGGPERLISGSKSPGDSKMDKVRLSAHHSAERSCQHQELGVRGPASATKTSWRDGSFPERPGDVLELLLLQKVRSATTEKIAQGGSHYFARILKAPALHLSLNLFRQLLGHFDVDRLHTPMITSVGLGGNLLFTHSRGS
jgi:hypothetical protein